MDGELHYRLGGRAFVREPAGDRRLFASVFRWDKPVRLSTGGQEWFTRSSEPPRKAAVLALLHGGRRAGQVVEWRSSILGLDAVLLADETPIGLGLLDLLDKHGELPVSPAFLGDGTRHRPDGVQWRNVQVPELAVVAEGELPWARLRRFAA